jgi:hypothetical protein
VSAKLLLDTHVLVWWLAGDSQLRPAQRRLLAKASADRPVLVSDISLCRPAIASARACGTKSRRSGELLLPEVHDRDTSHLSRPDNPRWLSAERPRSPGFALYCGP